MLLVKALLLIALGSTLATATLYPLPKQYWCEAFYLSQDDAFPTSLAINPLGKEACRPFALSNMTHYEVFEGGNLLKYGCNDTTCQECIVMGVQPINEFSEVNTKILINDTPPIQEGSIISGRMREPDCNSATNIIEGVYVTPPPCSTYRNETQYQFCSGTNLNSYICPDTKSCSVESCTFAKSVVYGGCDNPILYEGVYVFYACYSNLGSTNPVSNPESTPTASAAPLLSSALFAGVLTLWMLFD